ncbi:autotransporter domain-containing protein [Acetobacteraceae bacterium ESL0697]|nr:autotransporter domain-containing protein [Acetobacteraceae bacterium ESL0697]
MKPSYTFWNGNHPANNTIQGGNGTWTGASAGTGAGSWTDKDGSVNGPWAAGKNAIFMGNAGVVTVNGFADNGVATPVKISGMQFANNDGKSYRVTGDDLYATQDKTTIRVGDGTNQGSAISADLDTAINDVNVDGGTSLVKTDAGTLRVLKDQKYHGATDIQGGVLEVDASIGSSPVTVGSNAALAGTGSVGNVTANAGSIVSPGSSANSYGSLTVNGVLAMGKGSTLLVSVNDKGASKLNVNGKADLTGGQVDAVFKGGTSLKYGQRYTLVSTTGGVNGKYDSLVTNMENNYAFLAPTLGYTINDVDLYMGRNDKSFISAAGSRNEREVGRVLDGLPSDSAVIQAAQQIMKGEEKRGLNAFSGEIHASARTALIQDSFYVRQAAFDRLATADCDVTSAGSSIKTADPATGRRTDGQCNSDRPVLWGEAYGSIGNNSGNGNAASMHHSTTGFIMGADAPVFAKWRVGGMISYGRSMFSSSGRSSSGNSNNITVGSYAGTHWGDFHLRLGIAYTWNMMNLHHRIMYTGYNSHSNSNYRGGTAQSFAEVGYRFHKGSALFEPFANVAYVNLDTDKFSEDGPVGVRGKNTDTGVTFSTFGWRMSTTLKATKRMTLKPFATVAYRHAFGLLTPTVHQLFAHTNSGTMDIGGVPLSKDAAVVDAGFSMNVTDSMDLSLSYVGQYGNQSVDSGGRVSLKMSF